MLQTIKECIQSLPDMKFKEYFQDYVRSVQDKIILQDGQQATSIFKDNLSDTQSILQGLNKLTEELKSI